MVEIHKQYIQVLCISQFHLRPVPPWADPWTLAIFLPWMANPWGWGLLSCQIFRGEDEKRGKIPHLLSTLQHFSLTTGSPVVPFSAFLLQLTSTFVIALLGLHTLTTPVYGLSIVINLLTLKLIVCCKLS